MMIFSDDVEIAWHFDDNLTRDEMVNRVDELKSSNILGGNSALRTAFVTARNTFYSGSQDLLRTQIMFVATDGLYSSGENPCSQADEYADLGINMLLVGNFNDASDSGTYPACFAAYPDQNQVQIVDGVAFGDAVTNFRETCPVESQTIFDGFYDWEDAFQFYINQLENAAMSE